MFTNGCFDVLHRGHVDLLAAARRLAERLAQLRAPEGAVRPEDYRHSLREVIGRCIYGVDRNPMAPAKCAKDQEEMLLIDQRIGRAQIARQRRHRPEVPVLPLPDQ